MSQSPRLGLAIRALTLHLLDDPAAFGYNYGYGIQVMLPPVTCTGSCQAAGKDSVGHLPSNTNSAV